MSRIGRKPTEIPAGVTVDIQGSDVRVKGKLGELAWTLPSRVSARVEGNAVTVERDGESRESRSLHGLSRSLIANMIEGVSQGFTKQLEIQGVGFRAEAKGQTLSISLGFASPVEFKIPEGVTVQVGNGTDLTVSGADKQRVGDTAAQIRAFFPAEPYKGKGIRYKDERVKRKVGKAVA